MFIYFWSYVVFGCRLLRNYFRVEKKRNKENVIVGDTTASVIINTTFNTGVIDISVFKIKGAYNVEGWGFNKVISMDDAKKLISNYDADTINIKKLNIMSDVDKDDNTCIFGFEKKFDIPSIEYAVIKFTRVVDIGEQPKFGSLKKDDSVNFDKIFEEDVGEDLDIF